MSAVYNKLILRDGRLVIVPDDYAEKHELVLVRRAIAGHKIRLIVEAYAPGERGPWAQTIAAANERTVYGLPIKAPSIDEACMYSDRSVWPSAPKLYFPDIEDAWSTWTTTPDAEDPAGYAWAVGVGGGSSGGVRQSFHVRVRGVCPSQDLLDLGEEAA